MKVTLFHCGQAANESELKAFEHLKTRVLSEQPGGEWVLLTNLAFSVNHQLQSDEIDIVAIGPTGVRVIEIKHWSAKWFNAHNSVVEGEADKLTMKARKIGTTLRRVHPSLPYVDAAILLTRGPSEVKQIAGQRVRGVEICTLNDWKAAIGFNEPRVLTENQVTQLASVLQPKSIVAIDGSLRRLAGYVNLELQTPKEQRFHRMYKGSHPARRDKVDLHLYDLSASDDKNAETKAKRGFDALHGLQLYPWAPRILDSYQEAPGYEGEMFFFTIVDPAAPSIEERTNDTTWETPSRLAFVRNAVRALIEFHNSGDTDHPITHRNLIPSNILIKHDNSVILTGFERTRIPSDVSVASSSLSVGHYLDTVAPEVQSQGLSAADQRSDIYSICACLSYLFQDRDDGLSQQALELLRGGLAEKPNQRSTLHDLDSALSRMLGESVPLPSVPPARYWTEDQIVRFREHDYRIVSRLGTGGVGTAFKVVEIDRDSKEDMGTFVAKVAYDGGIGRRVLKSYNLVRSHLRHTALSTIFEVATSWQENQFIALMTWISGTPLAEFAGVFPLLAEDQQEPSSEALAVRWLRQICSGLDLLHKNGLIHGDVSPRNLIVSGSDLVLTDYDFAGKIDKPISATGTVMYSSPSFRDKRFASPSDDIYALAASFFHVVFEKEPFRYGGDLDKHQGLNWEGLNREEYPILAPFLDKATQPDPQMRIANTAEALTTLSSWKPGVQRVDVKLSELKQPGSAESGEEPVQSIQQPILIEQRVEWLRSLLQSYPGSRWGNSETRGLDTEFAEQTYVETLLEKTLLNDILERNVRLVILCGNAGDGKTALLQHLATRLGLGKHHSVERILEGQVPDGPFVRMNLDGSASWQDRSADELLDDFLEPFQEGPPNEDIVHLLAINDGRLLEWIESVGGRRGSGSTSLTTALYWLLQEEPIERELYIRFISLNQRSLIGGVTSDQTDIETTFLERLIDSLYGGERAVEIWSPCRTCSAKDRCEVFRAASLFGPESLPTSVDTDVRLHARQRLFEALQAVHLSGETHITVRELRAALVYILFGIDFCDDYHEESKSSAIPYWDRAFQANSPSRQGEVLTELVRFDPALEAHPQIDRHLTSTASLNDSQSAPNYPQLKLESARRRAFFEWTTEAMERIAEDRDALDLARGRHLRFFRDLPLTTEYEIVKLCERLCMGISRLEDLPPEALERPGVVPLRITPRTPTETAFWVEKPLSAFRLEADLPDSAAGIETLHRHAFLVYQYHGGSGMERLRLGAELFHQLLELAQGYQLGDVSTDDTFAHLSIFIQRLVREDEQELLAWNPIQDKKIYHVTATITETESGIEQKMRIATLASGGER